MTAGDGLLTYDTESKLEWLDLTTTLGMSYNQARASVYVTSLGFRFATIDDLYTLVAAAGLSPGSNPDKVQNIQRVIELLGCTTFCDVAGARAAQGFFDTGSQDFTSYSFFQYTNVVLGPVGENAIWLKYLSQWQTGNFLVRVGVGVEELLSTLHASVVSVGAGKSLANSVRRAEQYYAVSDIEATCDQLVAFLGSVEIQAGKQIDEPIAAKLASDAKVIRYVLSCPPISPCRGNASNPVQ